MNQQTNTSKKGFTIIEVVLVLAIAGLIFLMVFIALPALQRSQRDSQREQDLSRFMAQVNSYQSNNRGAVPAVGSVSSFVNNYLKADGDDFMDPNGDDYTFTTGVGAAPADPPQIRYATAARCGTDGAIVSAPGKTRQVAASIALEGGGALCQEN